MPTLSFPGAGSVRFLPQLLLRLLLLLLLLLCLMFRFEGLRLLGKLGDALPRKLSARHSARISPPACGQG